MAEPARKRPREESIEPDEELLDEELSDANLVHRWVEGPDGRMEPRDFPLTPEEFLNPQPGDKWLQGPKHGITVQYFVDLLTRHLESPGIDVVVLFDVKHRLGTGRRSSPCPDVSVIRGAGLDPNDPEFLTYDFVKHRIPPCLIIEVLSYSSARIRRTDEVDKVELYQRTGIQEYLLVDLPREGTGHRFVLKGYRLDPEGHYQPMEPDEQGRFLSETTQLLFAVSPEGDRVDVFDAVTGERLRSPREEEEGRRKAERQAARAEEEIARLRAELEQLKKSAR